MDVILIKTGNSAGANEIVSAVQLGDLWGVDMGTTSKASAYSNFALVECTATRATNLLGSIPENIDFEMHCHEICSFTESASEEKLWFLRGMIQAE